jgi:hypothetical protein
MIAVLRFGLDRLVLLCAAACLGLLAVFPAGAAEADASEPATAASVEPAGRGFDPMAERYRLGQGLLLGDSGFTLGGYANASVHETAGDNDWVAALDALSLFLWWDDGDAWHFFAETALTDAVLLQPGDTTIDEAYFGLERFYVDYVWRDAAKFRIGKFLTPVGRWNLIHAAPLVWTTSRPLISENTFPTNATGLMMYGVLPLGEDGVEYSLYASVGKELFPRPRVDTFSEAVGGHLSYSPLPHLQLGFSYVDFELDRLGEERRKLYGVDLHWSYRRYELTAEYAYRANRMFDGSRDEQGGYIQAVVPLTQKLYAVARYESFHQSGAQQDMNLYLIGLNYRLLPILALKAEYGRATDNDIGLVDGYKASIAVLF